MSRLTAAGLRRTTTDRLLDGATGPEPLRRLLAAAAAPPQADELRGEQAARLAFTTSAGFRPLPDVAAPHSPRRSRALSWIVAAKAIAAVVLTAGAGGVAVAATSSSFPERPPDVSTRQESDPDSATARPTVVVDRARDAALQPDTEPVPESSPGSPDSARRDGTSPGPTSSRTTPAARPGQPSRPDADAAPDDSTSVTPPTVAPANPPNATGPANGSKKSTAKTPADQQQEKENNGNDTPGEKKDHPGNSDDISDPRSDWAKQQKAGQE